MNGTNLESHVLTSAGGSLLFNGSKDISKLLPGYYLSEMNMLNIQFVFFDNQRIWFQMGTCEGDGCIGVMTGFYNVARNEIIIIDPKTFGIKKRI